MTIGPWYYRNPTTIEQAYHNVRFAVNQLEEQLEAHDASLDDDSRKRSDKGITVIKVGAKIIKKAFGFVKNVRKAA